MTRHLSNDELEAVRSRLRDYGSATLHGAVPARTFGVLLGDIARLLDTIASMQAERYAIREATIAEVDVALRRTEAERDEARDKALRFDLDRAGIASREAESVELVEARARVAELEAERDRLAVALAEAYERIRDA